MWSEGQAIRKSRMISRALDHTNLNSRLSCEQHPGFPIILIKGVLNADNGILCKKLIIQGHQPLCSDVIARIPFCLLETQIVLSILVELRCRHIHANDYFSTVIRRSYGLSKQIKGCKSEMICVLKKPKQLNCNTNSTTFVGSTDVGRKTTFITHIASINAIFSTNYIF